MFETPAYCCCFFKYGYPENCGSVDNSISLGCLYATTKLLIRMEVANDFGTIHFYDVITDFSFLVISEI